MTAGGSLHCDEIVEMVTDYLEGELDGPTTAALEAHLEVCPGCIRYVEQIRETIDTLGAITPDALSPETQTELLEAFRSFHRPQQ